MSSTRSRHSRSPAPPESKAIGTESSGQSPNDTDAESAESAAHSDPQDGSGHSEAEGSSQKVTKATRARKGRTSKSTSLWCPKTSLSHGPLQQWRIKKCPACKQQLRSHMDKHNDVNRGRSTAPKLTTASESAPTGANEPGSFAPRRGSSEISYYSTDYTSRSVSISPPHAPPGIPMHPPGPPDIATAPIRFNPYGLDPFEPPPMIAPDAESDSPNVKYNISFLSALGEEIGQRPYHELLDLQKERDAIINNKDPIIRLITVVQTNIKENALRGHDLQARWRAIMREGILRNPKYDVEVISENIKILSRRIIDRLKKTATYYPTMKLMEDEVILEEPYVFVFHNMDRIKSYQQDSPIPETRSANAEAHCDEETRRHIEVLCDAVELKHGANVEREMARYAAPVPKATFKMLWLLFKPGSTVYTHMNGGWQACVVTKVLFDHHKVTKLSSSYTLRLWYLNFDGRLLGRCSCVREIAPFDGEVEITSLNTFPAEYLDAIDGGRMRERLEARGEKFYKYLKGAQVHYSGESLGHEAHQVRLASWNAFPHANMCT